jgi:hypothetical protein
MAWGINKMDLGKGCMTQRMSDMTWGKSYMASGMNKME